MQFFRPSSPPPGLKPGVTKSISSAHQDATAKRLELAIKERQRLSAVENTAPAPISEMARQKGNLVSRRIDSLTAVQKDQT